VNKRYRLLAVDDTPENLILLQALLQDTYDLTVASDGAQALQLAQASPQPDLVLLDVQMPGLSGFDVLRQLRQRPATMELPVIFLTAAGGVREEQMGFDLGAVDYITKPLSPPVVLARIRTHLERSEYARRLRELSRTLGRYLPPQVCRAVFDGSQDGSIRTRRRKMTVFFSDIKDFTSCTARSQPEDITAMLNRYFSEMAAIVDAYGGTLNKFIGDAMMVFFGDPESRGTSQDAVQCVRMAVAMQGRMRELQAEWFELGFDRPFRIRCGINTGFCDVGNFGSNERMDYTIIGAEVNKAARLEEAAEPGGILVSRQTWALIQAEVQGEIRAHPVGPVTLKGFDDAVEAYAVGAEGGMRSAQREGPVLRSPAKGEPAAGEATLH
jgi:adenylate cyclase